MRQPRQQLAERTVGINAADLQALHGIGPQRQTQQLAAGERGSALLLQGQGRLDFGGGQLHPLAAHPHQRGLELGQRQQFLGRQAGLAEHDFPLDIQHPVQGHAGFGLEPGLGLGARRQLGATPARPTGRQHDAEAVLFQQRRFLAEKAKCAFGIQPVPDRRCFLQTGFNRRTQGRRLAQGREQAFPRFRSQGFQTLAGPPLRFPHRGGGNEQAGVFPRLQQVVDSPFRTGVGEEQRRRVLFVEPRFFQPKT